MPAHMVIGQWDSSLDTIVDRELACQQSLMDNQPKVIAFNRVPTNVSQGFLKIKK